MILTQDDYKLWTDESVNFDDADWAKILSAASKRLASFLCLDANALPQDDLFNELLANFIAVVLKQRGVDAQVEEKRVRNFTIRFSSSSAADAFSEVAQYYNDIIELYSQCGSGVKVERNSGGCCGCF